MAETVVPGNTSTQFAECITVLSAGKKEKRQFSENKRQSTLLKRGEKRIWINTVFYYFV